MAITSVESVPSTDKIERTPQQARLRPRRTLNRLALGLAGLAIATLGQLFFSLEALGDGLLCYALAVGLFTWALAGRLYPNHSLPHAREQALPFSRWPGIWRFNFGVWLILLAVTISFFAFNFLPNDDARLLVWWLYLASLIVLISGGLLLARDGSWRAELHHLLPNRTIAFGLLTVLGLAIVLRLYQLDQLPFGIWFDEAEAGLEARRMLAEPTYRPIFHVPINVTGHLLAVYAVALNWLGDSIVSMRLVSVLFGLGGVLAAYLFGRELRGPRFGLMLAFLVAVARWHLNFSRIAMTGIDTPFFEFLSLFFLIRLLRRGRLWDALWAGLGLGFGLVFYTAFRLFVLALLIFAVLAGLMWVIQRVRTRATRATGDKATSPDQAGVRPSSAPPPSWLEHRLIFLPPPGTGWSLLGQVTVLLLSTWLVSMPIAKFALDNPAAFRFRTDQVSIFARRDQPDLGQALWSNTAKHLLMFNYKGDGNGRHNLPGEPMLDPAMGILAVLGLGLVLFRPHHPGNAFFLILFVLALMGGIFSVDFEAPQALRSIAVLPALVYFIGLALAALGREAEVALSALPRLWLAGPLLGLTGFMLVYNAYLYFQRQANDFATWNAFSTPETIISRRMLELGPDYVYYLSPVLSNHPTTWFVSPHITRRQTLLLSDALPIREPSNRPVALFVHTDDARIFEAAQRLYPTAKFEVITGQAGGRTGPPIAYFAKLQPADLAGVQGLDLFYEPAQLAGDQAGATAPGREPLLPRRVPDIDLTWPDDSPFSLTQTEAGAFVAEWNGVLYIPHYGPYGLRLVTPASGQLEIDGRLIFDGRGEQVTGLPLAQGNHAIRLRAAGAPGQVALYWQPPGEAEALIPQWVFYGPPISNDGLLGTYYANDRWEGQPAFQRIDSSLDNYFHLPPLERPYTVEWTGTLAAPHSGLYQLSLRAITEAELFIDDQSLVATAVPDQYATAAIALEAGLHDIRIRFKDDADRSRLHLAWTTPAGRFEPIPSQVLSPPQTETPARAASIAKIRVEPVRLIWRETLGGPGSEPGQFYEPRDITVLANGNLVVADTVNRRVQILSSTGNPIQSLTGDELSFEEPLAVAANSRNEILVLDSTRQWIYRYDANGAFIDRFGGPTAYLFHPRGMTVFENDTLALADTGKGRLIFFSADGAQAGVLGGPGSGPGQFEEPTSVLRDTQGNYLVAEAMNHRLQQVDAAGNPLEQWSIPPAYALDGPHLAFGPDGSIFMTESQSKSLWRYAPDGTILNQWESIGPVNFAVPVGIYFDAATRHLYVTDVGTHQVYVFEVQS